MTLDVKFTEMKQTFDSNMGDSVLVPGQNGATFTPSVSQDGVISWTNDKGLNNPTPVNIKGADGKDGRNGTNGKDGVDGKDGVSPQVSVSQISNGHKVAITDANGTKSFNVLNGEKGEQGIQGIQGNKGDKGEQGEKGSDGVSPRITVTETNKGYQIEIVDAHSQSYLELNHGADGARGADGKQGDKGDKGDKGDQGERGLQGEQGIQGVQGIQGQQGEKGNDGYTPVRGTDYWTEADKAEIKGYVDEAILGGAW